MDKTHIDISTIEGAFTLELKNNLDNSTAFYDVYRHDDDGKDVTHTRPPLSLSDALPAYIIYT